MKAFKATLFFIVFIAIVGFLNCAGWPQSTSVWAAMAPDTDTMSEPFFKQHEQVQPSGGTQIVTVVEGLNEVTGASFDDKTGQLILIGRHDPVRPPLNLDDLAVALRVIYQGEAPAVSIDPNPNDNSHMQVAYFGEVENTHLGWVIFEADRLLKIYSLGRDNLTNQAIVSNVSGYKSVLARTQPGQTSGNAHVWYRMWFEPITDVLNNVKVSADHRAILFDSAHLTVQTEYIPSEGIKSTPSGSDPAAEEFVKHFNAHFWEFAQERPVLYELANIQRFLIIARWLRDEGIPINLSWLSNYPSLQVATPKTTPRIEVSQVITPYVFFLEGGVDLTKENIYTYNQPDASAMRSVVLPFFVLEAIQRVSVALLSPSGDRLTGFPIRKGYSNLYVDDQGNGWEYDAVRRQPLSFVKHCQQTLSLTDVCKGLVVNFEYDNEDRLTKLTFGPNRVVTFEYNAQNQMVNLKFEPSEDMIDLLYGLLAAADDATPLDPKSTWQTLFRQFFQLEQIGWPRLGKPVTVLSNQIGVKLMALKGYIAVYAFDQDQKLIIQRGLEQQSFDGMTVQALYNLLADTTQPELPAPLPEFLFPANQQSLIFIAGPPTPAVESRMRQLVYLLGKRALSLGIRNIYLDDDPRIALAHLESRLLVRDKDTWNLALFIDEASFSSDQKAKIDTIKSLVAGAGIPICTDWANVNCQQSNVIFLTGRPDAELVPIPSDHPTISLTLAALTGHLKNRYLGLLVAEQGAERQYAREFVVNYGATGVMTYDGQVTLDMLQLVLEKFIKLAGTSDTTGTLETTFTDAISKLLERSDLTAAQVDYLHTLLTVMSYISMRPPAELDRVIPV